MSKDKSGFYVDVFRAARGGDCTNGGISSRADKIFVISDGITFEFGPFYEDDAIASNIPVFVVGTAGGRKHLKPKGETRWTMFGGNFAYSSDSRTPTYPIAIHDRIEA